MVNAKGTGESSAGTFGVTEVQGTGGTDMKAVTEASGQAVGDPEGTGTGGKRWVCRANGRLVRLLAAARDRSKTMAGSWLCLLQLC